MTSTSSVKGERDVIKNEEEENDTFPFNVASTNVDDPLGDSIADPMGDTKAKKEFEDEDARLRSHSNSLGNVNYVKRLKVFIIPEVKPIGPVKCGRRPKYANEEERRKAKAEREKQRRAKMKAEVGDAEYLKKIREKRRVRVEELKKEQVEPLETEPGQSKKCITKYEQLLKERREYYRKRKEQIQSDPEKSEESKKKSREYIQKRRERLRVENPEKYAEEMRKMRESRKRRRKENPEKCEAQRQRDRMKYKAKAEIRRARQGQETEEKREMRKIKRRLYYRKKRETPEGREMLRFRQYSRVQMKIAQMTDEELAAFKAKQSEAAKKWRENLTGEKLEKYQSYLRNNAKRSHQKRLATMGEAYKAKINARCRHYIANETPEQRQRRLRRYKINQAMTRLRKQLEEMELAQEEVERKVTELKRAMEAEPLPPPETLSKYKPRVKSEVNFNFPPRSSRSYGGRRRGKLPGSSHKTSNSNSNGETSCDNGQSQPGMRHTETDDSNDFDDHGFQCDDDDPVPAFQFDIKCPHCPSTYSERSDLISHVSSEHSELCWKCPKCKLMVLSSDELSEHYKTEHFPVRNGLTETTNFKPASKDAPSTKENTFSCIKCDPAKLQPSERTFVSLKDLMGHVKSTHPNSFWPCSKCNLLKYAEASLKLHERICKPSRTFKQNGRKRMMKNI